MLLNPAKNYKYLTLKKTQQGSSLVIAIFIIVVMASLGATLLNMMTTNEEDYAYEVLGIRAYNAAQTGVQRKLQQIFPLNAVPNIAECVDVTFDLSTVDGLNQCSVNITCTTIKHNSVNYFTVSSVGQCQINGETTSRMVEVKAKSLN